MGGQLATGSSIYMASAGVPAADGAGLSSIKSFSQLLTSIAAMPLAGGTFTGNVLFTDNTYDIGASGATRPRTVYAGTSVITPLLNNTNAAALTLGNSTYGVTVPGNAHFGSGTSYTANKPVFIEATGANTGANYCAMELRATASTQYGPALYLNGAFQTGGKQWAVVVNGGLDAGTTGALAFYETSYGPVLSITPSRVLTMDGAATFSGDISMSKTSAQGYIRAYGTGGVNNIAMYDDNTNGILSTSSGNLNLVPTGGTVAVTGAGTYTGGVTALTGHFGAGNLYSANKPVFIEATGADSSTNYAGMEIRATGSNQLGPAIYLNGSAQTGGKMWAIYVAGGLDGGTVGSLSFADTSYGNVLSITPSRVMTLDGSFVCAGITASGVVSHGAYTVATLPAAGSNAGKMAQVTDSNVAASGNYGATVAAGGANRVKVFSDGTNWVIA